MVETELLQYDRRGEVAVLTLNRPAKRNALNRELVDALHRRLEELDADRALRAVVITGAGDHFMGGADIAELRQRRAADALDYINGALFQRVEVLGVPVIAAMRGFVVGGGCELALACDLRVAGRSARIGQPELGLGIIPGAGGTFRLPRLVGPGRARELILTGRLVDAEEALAMGLVNRVVPDERVLDEALALAGEIAGQGAEAVRLAKLILNAQAGDAAAGARLERLAQAVLFESEEKERRMTAFLERKRKPKSGRSEG